MPIPSSAPRFRAPVRFGASLGHLAAALLDVEVIDALRGPDLFFVVLPPGSSTAPGYAVPGAQLAILLPSGAELWARPDMNDSRGPWTLGLTVGAPVLDRLEEMLGASLLAPRPLEDEGRDHRPEADRSDEGGARGGGGRLGAAPEGEGAPRGEDDGEGA